MATRNKIGRLTERIEAVVERRRGQLSLEELTEEGWAKLKKLAAENPVITPCRLRPADRPTRA
jgi:hypothetical protein